MKKIQNINKAIASFFLIALIFVGFTSCGGDFDRPPMTPPSSDLKANITIIDLLEKYDAYSNYNEITDTLYIEGVVVGNDISGNIYKKMYIEDSTGGLDVEIDLKSIYNKYPIGQKVIVKLLGMAIGNYASQPQIAAPGAGSTVRLTEKQCEEHIVLKGFPSILNVPEPKKLTVKQVNESSFKYIGCLVQIDSVQFLEPGEAFSVGGAGNATDRYLMDVRDNSKMVSRNSLYAAFANEKIPSGTGSVFGILGTFRGTPQLFFRDIQDVKFASLLQKSLAQKKQ
ncbi:MAG: DUF5689 domain-containing protein [Bacteroidales bacterium]